MHATNRRSSPRSGPLAMLAVPAVLAISAVFGLLATGCTAADEDASGFGSEPTQQTAELSFTVDTELLEEPPELAPEQVPDLPEPAEKLPELEQERDALQQAVESPDVEILAVAELVDDGPTAEEIASFGDGHSRNATGELMILDEPASLACADTQIALLRLDESRSIMAADHISSAAERAARSELGQVAAWSTALAEATDGAGSVDPTVLVGFLSACIEGGYEL